ncbi:MAG TPA: hypothetical protein VN840_03720 [Streptosporangiaceae bacterium]|nr:hypothetical protein [Streptosporangiaceae bacterium]
MSDHEGAGKPELNAAAIVAALNRHQVRYVVIGAFAAIAQQAPIPATRHIDLTPEASQENLTRLSLALKELGARIRTDEVPDGLPFDHDATSLAAAEVWNLICADGEFDISFHPSGFTAGYAQLVVNAHRVRVGEVEVVVADLADVIRSKESAGRPKDLRVLPMLYRHQSARVSGGGSRVNG